jgi:hypothetical protein
VQKADDRGFDIFDLPPTQEGNFPALAVKAPSGAADADSRRPIVGFLSALCWPSAMPAPGWKAGQAAAARLAWRAAVPAR